MRLLEIDNIRLQEFCNAIVIEEPSNGKIFNIQGNHGCALLYVFSGRAEVAACGKKLIVRAGETMFRPATAIGTIMMYDEFKCVALYFELENDAAYEIEIFSNDIDRELEKKFFDAEHYWRQRREGYKLACSALFYAILAVLANRENITFKSVKVTDKLGETLDYLEKNYMNASLSVAELAQRSGVSYSYFVRLFREKIGTTPQQYIHALRMSHAKDLLRTGYYSVGNVATMVGYANLYYFSRRFKAQTGQTPTEYLYSVRR